MTLARAAAQRTPQLLQLSALAAGLETVAGATLGRQSDGWRRWVRRSEAIVASSPHRGPPPYVLERGSGVSKGTGPGRAAKTGLLAAMGERGRRPVTLYL
jgi:hypothetical protein